MPTQRSTAARGYGHQHEAARAYALANLRPGDPCSRCGGPMERGQKLDLDHSDDRTTYLGLAHSRCNRAAGARKANARRASRVIEAPVLVVDDW